MKCLNTEHPNGEPLPDWEIHLRDGFGRPGEAVGGVTGLVHTAEAALNAFFAVSRTGPVSACRGVLADRATVVDVRGRVSAPELGAKRSRLRPARA